MFLNVIFFCVMLPTHIVQTYSHLKRWIVYFCQRRVLKCFHFHLTRRDSQGFSYSSGQRTELSLLSSALLLSYAQIKSIKSIKIHSGCPVSGVGENRSRSVILYRQIQHYLKCFVFQLLCKGSCKANRMSTSVTSTVQVNFMKSCKCEGKNSIIKGK